MFSVVALIFIFFVPSTGKLVRDFLKEGFGEKIESAAPNLFLENEILKSELAKFQIIKEQLPDWSPIYERASVYSVYPFTFKNELLINVGKQDGILGEEAVLFEGVLFGRVDKVWESVSLVKTVFDSSWQSAVRIGSSGTEALLQGGPNPTLALIEKDADISPGDIVYSADSHYPYALPIGEVKTVNFNQNQIFKETALNFGYNVNKIQTVLIAKNYRYR